MQAPGSGLQASHPNLYAVVDKLEQSGKLYPSSCRALNQSPGLQLQILIHGIDRQVLRAGQHRLNAVLP